MDFIIGIFVGGLLFWIFVDRKKPDGRFIIDFSDPMKDVCRLELDKNINDIYPLKQIVLTVKTYGENTQK